jgi:ligand-binding sensor domain-containing protein
MQKTILLIFILVLMVQHVAGQIKPSVHYTLNDGLPSNNTRALLKDSRGVMWVGTDAGLVTYDGQNFTPYPLPDYIEQKKIWAIEEDPDGNLWFGTFGSGLLKYNGETFTHYTTPEITSDFIRVLQYSERYGCMLVGTQFGFSAITTDTIFNFVENERRFDERFLVMGFIEDKNGVIFHTFYDSAHHFDPETLVIKPLHKDSPLNTESSSATFISSKGDTLIGLGKTGIRMIGKNGIQEFHDLGQVFDVKEDKDGLVWIAVWSYFDMPDPGGIYTWNGSTLHHANSDWGIEGNSFWNIFVDTESKTIFISSEGEGLFKLLTNGITKYPASFFGTERLDIFDIKEFNGDLWLTTYDHVIYGQPESGFRTLDGKYFMQSDFYPTHQPDSTYQEPPGRFLSMYIDADQNFYIGSNKSLFKLINEKPEFYRFTIGQRIAENFLVLEDGRIYSSTELSLRFFPNIYSSSNRITLDNIQKYPAFGNNIIQRDDEFWFTSNRHGLYRFKNEQFKWYGEQHPDLPKNISAISIDKSKHIIIGTYNGQILIIEGSDTITVKYSLDNSHGIRGTEILWLLTDNQNRLWAGTNQGINIIDINQLFQTNAPVVRFINQSEGLAEFSARRVIQDSNGIIWLGGHENLIRIDPEKLLHSPSTPQKVKLTGFDINFHPVKWDTITETDPWRNVPVGKVALPHHQNNLTFGYTTDNLLNPDKVMYSYHLDGFVREPSPMSNSNEVTFTNLLPGRYTLRVEAMNIHTGIRYEPLELPFRILLPWWKTWYFYTTLGLAILVFVIFITRLRITRIKKMENIKLESEKRLNSIRIQAVQAQMNPHFVFNVLSSIQYFMLENDMDSTLEYLNDFSLLIRKTMENISEETISLADEIDYLKRYVKLEDLRLGNKVVFKIKLGKETDPESLRIPPMIIQPFVENALKHGLARINYTPVLCVSFLLYDDALIVKILDNGTGLNPTKENNQRNPHQSKGIKNTTERVNYFARKHSNAEPNPYGINLANRQKGGQIKGVVVEIKLPLMVGVHGDE